MSLAGLDRMETNFLRNTGSKIFLLSLFFIVASLDLASAMECSDVFGRPRPGHNAYHFRFSQKERSNQQTGYTVLASAKIVSDWRAFDRAVSIFESSQRQLQDVHILIERLDKVAIHEYSLSFRYRDREGIEQEATVLGGDFFLIQSKEGRRKVFEGHFMSGLGRDGFAGHDLDISSLKIEKLRFKDVDPEVRTSDFARLVGYRALRHQIRTNRADTLFEILRSGRFGRPKEEIIEDAGAERSANFFGLAPDKWGHTSRINPYLIEFDLRILDRKDYYMNPAWDYGVYGKDSVRFDEVDRLRALLVKGFTTSGMEVVVWAPVPLTWINKIYLKEQDWAELSKRLKKARVSPPPGREWSDLIQIIP